MFQDICGDISFALRGMGKRPAFTILVVLILALGLGANIAMFSLVHATLIRPLPFPDAGRLVMGRCTFERHVNPWASSADYYDYRAQSDSFESLAATLGFPDHITITGDGSPDQVPAILVSHDFFKTLGVQPHIGRQFLAEEGLDGGPPVAIISYALWQRRLGGSPSAIGQILNIGGTPHTIVGVLPAGFKFRAPCDVYRPMQPNGPYAGSRRFHNWLLVGRLKQGVTLKAAQGQVDAISARLEKDYPDSNKNKALLLTDLQEAMYENSRLSMLVLMAANAAVLLIACANVASILLARGTARRTELAIRAALGASRSRILRLILTESIVTAFLSGAAGLLLATWFDSLLRHYFAVDSPLTAERLFSGPILLFAVGLTCATGLLFGSVPALRGAKADVAQDLRVGGKTAEAARGNRFRSSLVVFQVAASVVLLICSGLLIRSFGRLISVDPGFQPNSMLTAEIQLPGNVYSTPEQRIQFYTSLREKLLAIPGISAVGIINQLPILNPGNNLVVYDADQPRPDPSNRRLAYQRVVFPGYFSAMGIPLIAGRDIQETDGENSPPVLVISRDMANQLFPNQNPLGKRVTIEAGTPLTRQVVGVVGDVHATGLASDPRWAMYGAYRQGPLTTMRLALRTQVDAASFAGVLRKSVGELDKDIPIAEVASMESVISRSVTDSRVLTALLSLFAGSSLILAGMGIYGVLAYYVNQRRREIGVRIALGAQQRDILSMVLSRGIVLVAIGLASGLCGSLAATRLLKGVLFNIPPTDPATFVGVSLFFSIAALLACVIPSWRAVRVDPVITLQSE